MQSLQSLQVAIFFSLFIISASENTNTARNPNSATETPDMVVDFMYDNDIQLWHMIVGVTAFLIFDFLLCFTCIKFFKAHWNRKLQQNNLTEKLMDRSEMVRTRSWIPGHGRTNIHPVMGFHFPMNLYSFPQKQAIYEDLIKLQ
ncbi:unnamed protein product [Blepharisma stoltei]|uniref:ATP synthase F0 subunit 8 n=1 Tax=Blepharisma stoltei TaxID=1481888 RepID=A0AAU9ITX9_9CILI|nr:unnamed protein product [Blepharisma stoltei]